MPEIPPSACPSLASIAESGMPAASSRALWECRMPCTFIPGSSGSPAGLPAVPRRRASAVWPKL